MDQLDGEGVVLSVIAVLFGAVLLFQLVTGRSWSATRMTWHDRGTDPFGYWLMVGILMAVTCFLAVSGLVILLRH